MNELIAQLNDITLPNGIDFALAGGWYLLGALLLVITIWVIYHIMRKRSAPKTLALQELENIKKRFNQHQNARLLAQECNQLIRRLMQYQYKQSLSSQQAFIEQLSKWQKPNDEILGILNLGIYQAPQNNSKINTDMLVHYCQILIKSSR